MTLSKRYQKLKFRARQKDANIFLHIKTQELTKKSKMVCNCPICNSETEINGEGCFDNILQEFKKYGFFI